MTAHCIVRAKERYGLDLTFADIARLERQIGYGYAVLVRKQPPDGLVYMVKHATRVLIAVVAPHRDNPKHYLIVTFLPQEALQSGHRWLRGTPPPARGRRGSKPHARRPRIDEDEWAVE